MALEKAYNYKAEELEAAAKLSDARKEAAEKKCYENHLIHQVNDHKLFSF